MIRRSFEMDRSNMCAVVQLSRSEIDDLKAGKTVRFCSMEDPQYWEVKIIPPPVEEKDWRRVFHRGEARL